MEVSLHTGWPNMSYLQIADLGETKNTESTKQHFPSMILVTILLYI